MSEQRTLFDQPPPVVAVVPPTRHEDLLPEDEGREPLSPDAVKALLADLAQSCAPAAPPPAAVYAAPPSPPVAVEPPPLTLPECIAAQREVCRLIAAKDYAAAEALAHQVLLGLSAALPSKPRKRKKS